MRHRFLAALYLILISSSGHRLIAQVPAPFSRGVNLTNWFQSDLDRLAFGKYDFRDFQEIKALGADVIRLPVDLRAMLKSDFSPDERFLFFMDKAASMADSAGIHLILDNHTFDPSIDTSPDVENWLIPAWQALARHYLGRFPSLSFEILNEPHGISDAQWNAIQLRTVAAVRSIDSQRWLVIGGAGWNGIWNLDPMPVYPHERLIYTYHFYEPFLFTHQGATWTSPSMLNLRGVPFPYNSGSIPNAPADLLGTWIPGALRDYANAGTVAKINELLDIPARFSRARNVPVFCGEFGVYIPNSPEPDRTRWYKAVRLKLEKEQMSWTMWDYHGGFGLFKKEYPASVYHDLNAALADSIGFTPPVQTPLVRSPERKSIVMYTDYVAKGLIPSVYGPGGYTSLLHVSSHSPMNLSISLAKAGQYSSIAFDFGNARDFSELRNGNATLDFKIRGTGGISAIDVRFIDSKTGTDDHPWRIKRTLSAPEIRWNGNWQTVSLPLAVFTEGGSWDQNQWFDPQGKFDWKEITRLEFVAEQHPLLNDSLFVDDIRLVYSPPVASESGQKPEVFEISLYPNPFNPVSSVRISLPESGRVRAQVFDITGRWVASVFDGTLTAGNHQMPLNAVGWSSGIYVLRVESGGNVHSRKFTLLK